MSDEEVYPLEDKEVKEIEAKAHAVGRAAEIKAAWERLPVKGLDPRRNVQAVAMWLLSNDQSAQVYSGYVEGGKSGGAIRVYIGTNKVQMGMPHTGESMDAPRVKNHEQFVIGIAKALCSNAATNSADKVQRGKWSIVVESVKHMDYKPYVFTYKGGRSSGLSDDEMILEALKDVGDSSAVEALTEAYDEKYDAMREKEEKRILSDKGRAKKLEKAGRSKMRREKAWETAKTLYGKYKQRKS